jgi:hypothetical protein
MHGTTIKMHGTTIKMHGTTIKNARYNNKKTGNNLDILSVTVFFCRIRNKNFTPKKIYSIASKNY